MFAYLLGIAYWDSLHFMKGVPKLLSKMILSKNFKWTPSFEHLFFIYSKFIISRLVNYIQFKCFSILCVQLLKPVEELKEVDRLNLSI